MIFSKSELWLQQTIFFIINLSVIFCMNMFNFTCYWIMNCFISKIKKNVGQLPRPRCDIFKLLVIQFYYNRRLWKPFFKCFNGSCYQISGIILAPVSKHVKNFKPFPLFTPCWPNSVHLDLKLTHVFPICPVIVLLCDIFWLQRCVQLPTRV